VDPVPDPLLLGKSGGAWNRTPTSRSVPRNSDHYTTDVVMLIMFTFSNYMYGNDLKFSDVSGKFGIKNSVLLDITSCVILKII
jgi:hypothetical protein